MELEARGVHCLVGVLALPKLRFNVMPKFRWRFRSRNSLAVDPGTAREKHQPFPLIDTLSAAGELIFHVFGAIAHSSGG